jgi:hypothetical protein
VIIHGAVKDITVEVVRRNPDDEGKGFVPQPKRWVVEQVNGTLMLHHRLVREYDHRPDNAASRVYWAATANMTRRLTAPGATRSWRPHEQPGRPESWVGSPYWRRPAGQPRCRPFQWSGTGG